MVINAEESHSVSILAPFTIALYCISREFRIWITVRYDADWEQEGILTVRTALAGICVECIPNVCHITQRTEELWIKYLTE
ncbi:hypothetical protein AV530_017313 [Patagioenas fasciata monilis]|uniref:Uncharacterized protein n=1 Tax=Patagioenas fasciata monilis TaxID=372326 RepID=A0A1V4JFX8_PATFA|nr:hypothetical protein AV530_017313 [Patagioenas fasciata monilis]